MQPKILIVDDREDNLVSIEAILAIGDYRVIKANSGNQALKILLTEHDFALILMDVQMPNINGFETASLIYEREKLKYIPIIFITANSYGEENIFKGYKAGAVDYIYKPINPDLLRAKVAVFVDLYTKNHKLHVQEQKLITINKSLENEINERKNTEEKINALNLELLKNIDNLEAANRELDRFAFMASHDLQEPLRKIRMFGDRLFSDYKNIIDEAGQKYIVRIQSAAERMQRLIEDILMFSKISSDDESFTTCDLNGIVNDVLIQMEEFISEKNAKIIVGKLPALKVNPVLMYPLFSNLINNALKYSRKDASPVVKIYVETEDEKEISKDYCRIYIEDNGIGFEQKHSEQIFAMFRRLHGNNEYEGTGIGLALCKKIVEKHRGFISARGKVNEGATFIISLPVNTEYQQVKKSVENAVNI